MRFLHHSDHHESKAETWYQKEELANTITHFIAFTVALVGFYFLLHRAAATGSQRTLVACSIYALSVWVTFLTSTIYHFSTHDRTKHLFHILDHMVIYLMIAGTYTPFTLITLSGVWGRSIFAFLWTLTVVGFIFKLFFTGRFRLFSTAIYVLMGWIGVIAIVPIIEALPAGGLFWLILSGALFTIGVIFYLMESLPFSHTIWHLFVMAGALAQFICIYNFVV